MAVRKRRKHEHNKVRMQRFLQYCVIPFALVIIHNFSSLISVLDSLTKHADLLFILNILSKNILKH
jgi:hypothetical protein